MRKAMVGMFSVLLMIAVSSSPALADRTTGVVKWFAKGMGYLTAANGDEIFVHSSALSASCNGTLKAGQAVEFEIEVVKQTTQAGTLQKRAAKDVTCR